MTARKLSVFISAYACEPHLGSEIGVGWHWVLEMSKYFDLFVLTRQSNRHTIESWIASHPEYNHIHFLYYDLLKWTRFWKKGLRGVHLYYMLWQWRINPIVKRTMQENDIQIFHHLTYGNFLWSVSTYGQKRFFVWGPGSIGNSVPREFSKEYSIKGQVKETLQRMVCKTLKYNRRFKKQCRNSNLILCKTIDTHQLVSLQNIKKAVLFTDVASQIESIDDYAYINQNANDGIIKYVAVGSLEGWRGFDILIEAFSIAIKTVPNIELEILGEGGERGKLKRLILKLMVSDKVHLSGKVSMDEYYKKLVSADVAVNPCLREGSVTMAFDAISLGKPLLCIETGGYTQLFNESHAVIIPLGTRRDTIDSITKGIVSLSDINVRRVKGGNAQKVAEGYTWAHKGRMVYELINGAYSEWIEKKKGI